MNRLGQRFSPRRNWSIRNLSMWNAPPHLYRLFYCSTCSFFRESALASNGTPTSLWRSVKVLGHFHWQRTLLESRLMNLQGKSANTVSRQICDNALTRRTASTPVISLDFNGVSRLLIKLTHPQKECAQQSQLVTSAVKKIIFRTCAAR